MVFNPQVSGYCNTVPNEYNGSLFLSILLPSRFALVSRLSVIITFNDLNPTFPCIVGQQLLDDNIGRSTEKGEDSKRTG